MTKGYLYCLYGDSTKGMFEKELIPSFKSLKKKVPGANVCLYTNIVFDNSIYGFNKVIFNEKIEKSTVVKAEGLLKSPFKKTIFLDCDTIVESSRIDSIFDALKMYDFAMTYGNAEKQGSIFPGFNTGLVAVKKNNFTNKIIKEWLARGKKRSRTGKPSLDQKHLRDLLDGHQKRYYLLPHYVQLRHAHAKSYPDYAYISHGHRNKEHPENSLKAMQLAKIIETYQQKLILLRKNID